MRPDIVIRREGVPVLVIDAKYKLDPAQSDLYQALAYCHGLEVGAAVLVHPLSEAIPTSFVRVRGPGGFEIHYLPMSLGGNPKELRSHGDLLVRRVAAMLSPREASATTQPLEALRVSIEGGR
jgi:hypothetical protein